MLKELEELQRQAESELRISKTEDEFLAVRTKYLGRKGLLTKILRNLGNIEPEERPLIGNRCNEIKNTLTEKIENALKTIAKLKKDEVLLRDRIDVTLPGRKVRYGKVHPITLVCQEICDILARFGFAVVEGPEIELDYYNFEALNIPQNHPARDMQDTFYVEDNIVLRTHTSPVQIRVMEKQRPPVRILSPGRVYRPDSDISHTPMFHQIEGLLVDKGITFGDLKGVLTSFLKQMFGVGTALRFRPSFFPFTEPSAG
jgi:phenylalanyl-tRNA synthetase alpha chain